MEKEGKTDVRCRKSGGWKKGGRERVWGEESNREVLKVGRGRRRGEQVRKGPGERQIVTDMERGRIVAN